MTSEQEKTIIRTTRNQREHGPIFFVIRKGLRGFIYVKKYDISVFFITFAREI